ncbi:Oxysterol-binding protein-related protein 6 [Halotydeus destructor]|nr:Oxysterol-binding protein-related protein 6 [Halotydeus destructor]
MESNCLDVLDLTLPTNVTSNSLNDSFTTSSEKLIQQQLQAAAANQHQSLTISSAQQVRRSPLTLSTSDINGADSESLKSSQTNRSTLKKVKPVHHHRRSSEWEILEGLKDGQRYDIVPPKFEGFLLKRRKWPLKGWHKRYFSLDAGILNYSKTPAEMAKGKIHGSVDVGLSVISTKFSSRRIDIDAEEFLYHIKSKSDNQFVDWVTLLKEHRLYRQHEINSGSKIITGLVNSSSRYAVVGLTTSAAASAYQEPSHSRVSNWIIGSKGKLDKVSRELSDLQVKLVELSSCLQLIELQTGARKERIPDVETGSLKKYKKRFLLRRHKKTNSTASSSGVTGSTQSAVSSLGPRSLLSKATAGFRSDSAHNNAELHTVKSDSNLSFNHGLAAEEHGSTVNHVPSTLSAGQNFNQGTSITANRMSHSCGEATVTGSASGGSGSTGNIHQAAGGHSNGANVSLDSRNVLEDFLSLAGEVHSGLRSCLKSMQYEKEFSKQSSTPYDQDVLMVNTNAYSSLKFSLNQALDENVALRAKLSLIHAESNVAPMAANIRRRSVLSDSNNNKSCNWSRSGDSSMTMKATPQSGPPKDVGVVGTDGDITTTTEDEETTEEEADEPTLVQPIGNSKSYESASVLSISEYFDAAEKLSHCSTSSEDDDDGSCATDLSGDDGLDTANAQERKLAPFSKTESTGTGRRNKLPCYKPETGDVSLWGLLCKNIGKDLSKISMPVTLNEPLSMLQRLCEELEYSDILEKAASIEDPCERLVYVAAFAVSPYGAACYRAGHKPFNPLLGESYECVREDKGFRFVSEQVSHHPPVSACHAEAEHFIFWQDMRIKTKFWGKSMEIIPFGNVHLELNVKHKSMTGSKCTNVKSKYRWNKVTTCVHNIFKGQRWVDQYGEMIIVDETNGLKCSLTFVKASYWSNKKHEVYGSITNTSGQVLEHMFGKWDEALWVGVAPAARCVWRPGAMPDDNQRYYGFSRFAMELNELTEDLEKVLPITDTRFRPDQRLLEEGRIQDAEATKSRLENLQRDKRRDRELNAIEYQPRWFKRDMKDGEEIWTFKREYWKVREQKQFKSMELEALWPDE